jgi:hypothetical protein
MSVRSRCGCELLMPYYNHLGARRSLLSKDWPQEKRQAICKGGTQSYRSHGSYGMAGLPEGMGSSELSGYVYATSRWDTKSKWR